MTKEQLAAQAAAECCNPQTTAHHGGGVGRPFWNPESFQFMYAPAFQFQCIPGCKRFRYEAVDADGKLHTFEADNAKALLAPIWGELPEGVVQLKVYSVNADGSNGYLIGARTFMKLASFPADLPGPALPYSEAAIKIFEYAMGQRFIQHWITDGIPDPDYNLYVYPSKMYSAVINAMIAYAKVKPEMTETALTVAKKAADYLISISQPAGSPMEGVPPTYYVDFRPNPETRSNAAAMARKKYVMMIYPAHVGTAYIRLAAATGDRRYLEAAEKIGLYYLNNVEPNGSWMLIREIETGIPYGINYADPLERIVPFLMALYETTGEEKWKSLADGAIAFVENDELVQYRWEAQFEDTRVSANYDNLTHYGAAALVRYYAKYFTEDAEKMARAEDLMRFVEDQFVIWKKPSPWSRQGYDTTLWHTPCGLEQYVWYQPIDASTSDILLTFLEMYKATGKELYLEKAKALADSITQVQLPNGLVPTQWTDATELSGAGFWLNCLFVSGDALADLGTFLKEQNL